MGNKKLEIFDLAKGCSSTHYKKHLSRIQVSIQFNCVTSQSQLKNLSIFKIKTPEAVPFKFVY
jgi:hypothetical protein